MAGSSSNIIQAVITVLISFANNKKACVLTIESISHEPSSSMKMTCLTDVMPCASISPRIKPPEPPRFSFLIIAISSPETESKSEPLFTTINLN